MSSISDMFADFTVEALAPAPVVVTPARPASAVRKAAPRSEAQFATLRGLDDIIEEVNVKADAIERQHEAAVTAKSVWTPAFAAGQEVDALWDEDNLWYRARIDAINFDDRSYSLTFTEYGNSQQTKEANVRASGVSESGALNATSLFANAEHKISAAAGAEAARQAELRAQAIRRDLMFQKAIAGGLKAGPVQPAPAPAAVAPKAAARPSVPPPVFAAPPPLSMSLPDQLGSGSRPSGGSASAPDAAKRRDSASEGMSRAFDLLVSSGNDDAPGSVDDEGGLSSKLGGTLTAEERKELIRREALKLGTGGSSTRPRTIDLSQRASQEGSGSGGGTEDRGTLTKGGGAAEKRKSKGFLQRRSSKNDIRPK